MSRKKNQKQLFENVEITDIAAEGMAYNRPGCEPRIVVSATNNERRRCDTFLLCHPFRVRATACAVSVGSHPRLCYSVLSGLLYSFTHSRHSDESL